MTKLPQNVSRVKTLFHWKKHLRPPPRHVDRSAKRGAKKAGSRRIADMDTRSVHIYWSDHTTGREKMKIIGATRFRERCLALLDELDEDGLIITKHGKPVARLLPIERQHAELIGSLRHKVDVGGDILSTGTEWDAGAFS